MKGRTVGVHVFKMQSGGYGAYSIVEGRDLRGDVTLGVGGKTLSSNDETGADMAGLLQVGAVAFEAILRRLEELADDAG